MRYENILVKSRLNIKIFTIYNILINLIIQQTHDKIDSLINYSTRNEYVKYATDI